MKSVAIIRLNHAADWAEGAAHGQLGTQTSTELTTGDVVGCTGDVFPMVVMPLPLGVKGQVLRCNLGEYDVANCRAVCSFVFPASVL